MSEEFSNTPPDTSIVWSLARLDSSRVYYGFRDLLCQKLKALNSSVTQQPGKPTCKSPSPQREDGKVVEFQARHEIQRQQKHSGQKGLILTQKPGLKVDDKNGGFWALLTQKSGSRRSSHRVERSSLTPLTLTSPSPLAQLAQWQGRWCNWKSSNSAIPARKKSR